MRITLEIDYAFRIVAHLAERPGQVVGAPVIAEEECIPDRFTLRILRKLNLAGITGAKRGANGGYYLAKDREEITLYDIILAVDGPIEINRCLMEENSFCSRREKGHEICDCPFHNKLGEIQEDVVGAFKEQKIVDFLRTDRPNKTNNLEEKAVDKS